MTPTFELNAASQPVATSEAMDAFIQKHAGNPDFWLQATDEDIDRIGGWLQTNKGYAMFPLVMLAVSAVVLVAGELYAYTVDMSAKSQLQGQRAGLMALTAVLWASVFGPLIDGPGSFLCSVFRMRNADRISRGLKSETSQRVDGFIDILKDHPKSVAFLRDVQARRTVTWGDFRCAKLMAGMW